MEIFQLFLSSLLFSSLCSENSTCLEIFSPALKEDMSHFLSKLNPIPPASPVAPPNIPLFPVMLIILSPLTSLWFIKDDQNSPILIFFFFFQTATQSFFLSSLSTNWKNNHLMAALACYLQTFPNASIF